jgi:hypothetical protein
VFTPRAASNLDDPGLMITVTNISFSAPTYRVSRRAATLHARLVRRNRRVSVTSAAVAACRWHRCTATVYRLDGTYTGRAQVIGSAHSDSHGATLVRLTAAKLPPGVTYLVLVRRGHQLVAGTRGKACPHLQVHRVAALRIAARVLAPTGRTCRSCVVTDRRRLRPAR